LESGAPSGHPKSFVVKDILLKRSSDIDVDILWMTALLIYPIRHNNESSLISV